MTIDELAAAAETTTRRVRSLQTLGLVPHPALRGRTGIYGQVHEERLGAVLRLQRDGFSLESVRRLFQALDAGETLADLLGIASSVSSRAPASDVAGDDAELYGFTELQGTGPARRPRETPGRPLLFVVPTTVWDESEAS